MPDFHDPVQPQPVRPNDQRKALDLASGFREHDLTMLRRLDGNELAEQRDIREQLWHYVDEMWDFIKEYRERHAARNPTYSAVMGMRNLAAALCDNVGTVAQEAEDDLGN